MNRERLLYARVVRRGWLQRTLQVSGDVQVLIEYDARRVGLYGDVEDAEVVRVDGLMVDAMPSRIVRRSDPWNETPTLGQSRPWRRFEIWEEHRITIPLATVGETATLEVELTNRGVASLRYLKLSIGFYVVYEEQGGQAITLRPPPTLPVPADPPSPDLRTLPIPPDCAPGSDADR